MAWHTVPGFPEGLSGPELMTRMREQSTRFGTDIRTETIGKVDLSKRPFTIWIEGTEDQGESEGITCDALIVATYVFAFCLVCCGAMLCYAHTYHGTSWHALCASILTLRFASLRVA